MHAIELALRIIEETQNDKCVIFSELLSVVQSIERRSMNNIIRRILHGLHEQAIKGNTVEIGWVPGHAGLK